VDDVFRVAVDERVRQLRNQPSRPAKHQNSAPNSDRGAAILHWFVKALVGLLLHEAVEFAARGVLEDQVDSGVVVEVAVHPKNVRMPNLINY
jgi:hypothetical protein